MGLPVTVELRVVNPLGLRIELTSLRLFGTLIPASVSPDTAATVPGAFKGPPCSDHSEAIAFSSTTIELEPTQSAIVRLMATPLKPGRLCLQGKLMANVQNMQLLDSGSGLLWLLQCS